MMSGIVIGAPGAVRPPPLPGCPFPPGAPGAPADPLDPGAPGAPAPAVVDLPGAVAPPVLADPLEALAPPVAADPPGTLAPPAPADPPGVLPLPGAVDPPTALPLPGATDRTSVAVPALGCPLLPQPGTARHTRSAAASGRQYRNLCMSEPSPRDRALTVARGGVTGSADGSTVLSLQRVVQQPRYK